MFLRRPVVQRGVSRWLGHKVPLESCSIGAPGGRAANWAKIGFPHVTITEREPNPRLGNTTGVGRRLTSEVGAILK